MCKTIKSNKCFITVITFVYYCYQYIRQLQIRLLKIKQIKDDCCRKLISVLLTIYILSNL